MTETMPSPLNNVMTIDDERIKNHLDRVVRGRVGGDVERASGCGGGTRCVPRQTQLRLNAPARLEHLALLIGRPSALCLEGTAKSVTSEHMEQLASRSLRSTSIRHQLCHLVLGPSSGPRVTYVSRTGAH
jgi:hypothetical protein